MCWPSPLWQAGFNYDHGTGHGVGHVLSVHEGPRRIFHPRSSTTALEAGMVLSNEPGYYREGLSASVARIWSWLNRLLKQVGEIERYAFRNLTLVPFDKRLYYRNYLTGERKAVVE